MGARQGRVAVDVEQAGVGEAGHGVGAGMVLMPTMTTATRDPPRDRLAGAGTAPSINSQVWASVVSALLSVLLGAAGAYPAGFRIAYAAAAGLLALLVLPATLLPARRPGKG